MKRKIALVITLGVLVIVTIILLSVIKKEDTFDVTLFKKSYSIITSDSNDSYLEVLFYVSDKSVSFVRNDKILSSSISDKNKDNLIELKAVDVVDRKYTQVIKNRKFHLYSFIFTPITEVNDDFVFELDKAYLNINNSDMEYMFYIGSFYMTKVPFYGSQDDISLSNLKPLVGFLDRNKTLVGVGIELNNYTNKKITIKSFEFLRSGIKASNKDIVISPNNYYPSQDIDDILGYQYNVFESEFIDSTFEKEIESKSKKEFFIPLKYHNKYSVNSLGIVITYEINNSIHKMYVDEFTFFKDNSIVTKYDEVILYSYDKC